jgi:hypothetical protein
MNRLLRVMLLLAAISLAAQGLFAQRHLIEVPPSPVVIGYQSPFGGLGGFGGYGGYGFPRFDYPGYIPPYTYAPNYWWVGPNGDSDPRQSGYNPSAGYEWDSVLTLILTTLPARAGVTLDGIFVGTADKLGPFQITSGDHTLRVAA